MQVFNTATQKLEDVTWSVDKNNELVATFADESFLKFPAGLSKAQLQDQVDLVAVHNAGQEIITPEREAEIAEERSDAEALVNSLNELNPPKKGVVDEPTQPAPAPAPEPIG